MRSCLCLLILGLGLLLSGCADVAYWQLRTFYEMDCRPEVVQANNGKCVYLKKGNANAQTAHP